MSTIQPRARRAALILTATAGVALAGCAGPPDSGDASSSTSGAASSSAAEYPVEVESCGHTSTVKQAPTKAITLNQGATEVMLALGLEDSMAGTAYLDDAVAPRWKTAYESVPVLANEYPSHEKILATDPDFVYASYGSAFEDKVAGTQAELDADSVASYLSPFGCDDKAQRPDPSFDAVWDEVDEVAEAFGVEDRAEQIRTDQQAVLEEVKDVAKGKTVLWYDGGTKTPNVGAGGGSPQVVMDAIGATNIFADLEGGWGEGSWEQVVEADPDVIVLADAAWDSAKDKRAHLESDPALTKLKAVQDSAFVTVPFSETTAGVRLADGVASVADQVEQLRR